MGVFVRSDGDDNAKAVPFDAPRPLRASAQVIKLDTRTEIETFARTSSRATGPDAWQSAAWDYFDEVGEVKYAFYVMANTISRVRIYPGVITDPARPPQHVDEVKDLDPGLADACNAAMRKLASGPGGIPTLLRDLALNLCVPGEGYLVQIPERAGSGLPETWAIYSADAVKVDAQGHVALKLSPYDRLSEYTVLPRNAFVGRIWRSHPRYANEADSSMRGLLGLLEELMLLNRTVRATARSRLNAGLLYLPDGLSVARSEATPYTEDLDSTMGADPSASGTGDDEDEFENELIDAMTTPIQDEDSASAVVPLIVRGPLELGDAIKLIKFERAFDPALATRAQSVLDRILSGLDIPKEIVKGLADVKYALSTDAEILTRAGWKTYDSVTVGEDVLTLNHTTGQSEWQPLQEINIHDHDGLMLRMQSMTHSSLSTPEHRWAVVKTGKKVAAGTERRWTTSEQGFTSTDRIETAASCATLPTEAKYLDDFVRLVALYASDGWRERPSRGQERANVTKTVRNRNPQVLRTVHDLLMRVDPAHAQYQHTSATPSGDSITGTRFRLSVEASEALFAVVETERKIIRSDFIATLTSAQLSLFLDTLVEIGDGNLVDGSTQIRRYWQTDQARLEPIAMASVLAGHTVRWLPTPITPSGDSAVPQSKPCWGLTVTRARTRFVPAQTEQTWEDYTGQVWCPTTANHTWLARQNGTVFFTGNSNAVVIDDQFFRSNVEPLVLMICDALTTVYLRQYLLAHKFTDEQISRIVTWYDPKDVVVRPNQNEDATQGFDRYAISADAWRRTHGFSETDAPDEAEVIQRLVISKGQLPDALTEALLRVFAPAIMAQARAANPEVDSNLPPEVQQALGVPPSEAPAPPAAKENAQPTPAPDVPAPPYAKPRQPDEPITAPPGSPAVGNPAA